MTTMVSSSNVADLPYVKFRQLEGNVVDNHLMPYATKILPADIMLEALRDFFPEELPEGMDRKVMHDNFFMQWFLFDWIPYFEDEHAIERFDVHKTIAQNYLENYETQLNGPKQRFIRAISKTYYSYYSVLEVNLDTNMIVKDILLGTQHLVKERQGTHTIKRGSILLGRILSMDNQSMFVGLAPYSLPALYQTDLIQFRDCLREEMEDKPLDGTALREELDQELFDYFFNIMDSMFNQKMPELRNTEGDPIQLSKSRFKLDLSPELAADKLLPLTLSANSGEILLNAKRDDSGCITRIDMNWLKDDNKQNKAWNNTIMGHIIIEPNRLTLETNSENRTVQGKELLEKYLGKAILYQNTLIESPEQKLKSQSKNTAVQSSSEELMKLPEVQEQLKQMSQRHWENWFDEPIPALNNQTPRESAKSEKGQELLEALLLHYEAEDSKQGQNNPFKADVNYLKAQLNLT